MLLLRKALLGGAALTLAVLASGGYTVTTAGRSSAEVAQFERRDAVLQKVVLQLQRDFYNYDDQTNMYVLVAATAADQTQLWQDTHGQAVEAADQMQEHLAQARSLTGDSAVISLLDRVERDKAAYDQFSERGYAFVRAGKPREAAHEVTIANLVPSNDIMPALEELQVLADQRAAASLAAVTAAQRSVQAAAVVSMIVVTALVVLLVTGFVRVAVRPMRRLAARMRLIGEGDADLTQRIDARRNDELGELSDGFDSFVAGIQALVVQFAGTAEALAGSATHLSATSAELSHGANRSATLAGEAAGSALSVNSGVEMVTTGTEQMTASISEIAGNAGRAAEVAQESLRMAEQTNSQIALLGQASQEITGVVALITTIAEQTNLLALNATIEAARAGESGKGFAVVANEVKELAHETARATEDITARIAVLQDTSVNAAAAIGRISEVIHDLNGYSASIAAAVEEQSVATNDMSHAISGASASSTHVAQSFAAVAQAADATAAGAEASRRAADDLVGIAAVLHSSISRFRYR